MGMHGWSVVVPFVVLFVVSLFCSLILVRLFVVASFMVGICPLPG